MVAKGEVAAVGIAPPSWWERLKDVVAPLLRNRIAHISNMRLIRNRQRSRFERQNIDVKTKPRALQHLRKIRVRNGVTHAQTS